MQRRKNGKNFSVDSGGEDKKFEFLWQMLPQLEHGPSINLQFFEILSHNEFSEFISDTLAHSKTATNPLGMLIRTTNESLNTD